MTSEPHTSKSTRLEASAWIAFAACCALVPLAVSKLPSAAPLTYTVFGYPQSLVLMVGVSIALVLWSLTLLTGQTGILTSWQMIPFACFIAWATISTAAAYDPMLSLLGGSTSSLALVGLVANAALAFLSIQLVSSRRRMDILTWAVIASSSIVGLVALAQQFFQANVFGLPGVGEWLTGRGFSTIGNPDQLGTFLVLPLMLSVFLFVFEDRKPRQVAAGLCLAVLATALTGTLTRGAWIAEVVGGLVALTLLWQIRLTGAQRRQTVTALGVFAVAVAVALLAADSADLASRFAAGPQATPTAESALSTANAVTSDRINVWRAAMLMLAERPLVGTGPGAFQLGWYTHAVAPSSAGGDGAIADDAHSLVVNIAATTGLPGLVTYLLACAVALTCGARTSITLLRAGPPSGKALCYVAWFVGACALQTALLVGAVSPPIVMYSFLSLAVLLRPTVQPRNSTDAPAMRVAIASACLALAVGITVAAYPSLRAELALAQTLRGTPLDEATQAARAVPWNIDAQKAYFHLRVTQARQALDAGSDTASDDVAAVVDELEVAAAEQPYEYYFPSVRAQLLVDASDRTGEAKYAQQAVQAANDALAIMPASIPTRVNKARALGALSRYEEMAEALSRYWENETGSAYPGILYAQALYLTGRTAKAEDVFEQLSGRFPSESGAIADARVQLQQPPQ